jgi:hypothetical protein
MMRLVLVGATALMAAVGCSSTTPRNSFDTWASRAVSADVVADRARAERLADTLFAHLPVKPVAVTSSDSCVVRPPDLWHYNEYHFSCHLDEIRYVPVDGDLLPLLVKIDTAALANSASATEPLQNVQYYFAHGGRVDGLQLSKPRLVYQGSYGVLAVDWHDPAFPEATTPPTTYPAAWPEVYRTQTPAVDVPKLAAAHDNMLAIHVSQTYFKLTERS